MTTQLSSPTDTANLYDRDYYLWLSHTAQLSRLRDDFQVSPGLKRYFEEVFDECYQDGREQAADETGLPLDTFPEKSPFTPTEVLNPDYLPQD